MSLHISTRITPFLDFLRRGGPPLRHYAARKGTRERKEAKKRKAKKVEEVKVGFVPHNQREREKLLAERPKLKFDDSWKGLPIDDVYVVKYYQWTEYPFKEAVQFHRETHHQDMYNCPTAPLHVRIELYMQGEKKTRFVDDFYRIVGVPHSFDHGDERAVVSFSKSPELLKESLDKGAQLAGGVELIKQIQTGGVSLQNFDFVIAHPDILPELVALRGLMKRKFPNTKNGTLDVDLGAVTERLMNGISYSAKKDEYEKDFGLVEAVIGRLDMDEEHLEGNFKALVRDIYGMRPRREGGFISRCLLWSPPSQEKFKVGYKEYVKDMEHKGKKVVEQEKGEDEDETAGERVTL